MKRKIGWTKNTNSLFEAILSLKNIKDCQNFFRDLLTEKEIFEFSNRWKAAKMLSKGATYEKISTETKLSSRTIARINQWLRKGTGGYQKMIKKQNYHNPKTLEKGL
jgi:TrpR-related protein YerC/YecD